MLKTLVNAAAINLKSHHVAAGHGGRFYHHVILKHRWWPSVFWNDAGKLSFLYANPTVGCFALLLKWTRKEVKMEQACYYHHSGFLSCKDDLNALPPPPITGYHPECHTPTIEPEADSDSWICRQCVFAVATKVRLLISPSHFFF